MNKHFLVVVSLLAISSVAGAEVVTPSVPERVVRYDDLRLTSRAGIEKLYARLKGAAEVVCDSLESRELGRYTRYAKCVRESLSRAVAAVANDDLANLHARRTGKTAILARS